MFMCCTACETQSCECGRGLVIILLPSLFAFDLSSVLWCVWLVLFDFKVQYREISGIWLNS